MVFLDRRAAGQALAALLADLTGRSDVTVLGLPRGGVPVAAEVARALAAPLDVVVVRKVGVPDQRELAMGAIAPDGVRVDDERVLAGVRVSAAAAARVLEEETAELSRRERLYREGRPPPELTGRVAVLVDDGLATGSTMRAAARWVQLRGAASVVVAVPAAPRRTVDALTAEVDRVVAVVVPERFRSVGEHYADFDPPSDDAVRRLLREDR